MSTPFHISTHDQGDQVSITAHTAKPAAPTQTGRAATLRGLLSGVVGSSASSRSLRALASLLLVLLSTALALVAAPAQALTNPERAYEMVTPPYKGGFGADKIEAVAEDGESVAFNSFGTFAGAPSGGNLDMDYVARRGPSGWESTPVMPPAILLPSLFGSDITPSLDSVLEIGNPGVASQQAAFSLTQLFLRHATDLPDISAYWETLGVPLEQSQEFAIDYKGASADLCHLVFNSGNPVLLPVPPAAGKQAAYELTSGCNGAPRSLRLVGLNNETVPKLIDPGCNATPIGVGQFATAPNTYNAISADGEEVFFTECVHKNGPLGEEPGTPHQLFVRLAGSRTLEVSKPLAEASPCAEVSSCSKAAERASSDFVGASEDGSRVYFTAPLAAGQAPLVPGATDSSNNLYLASIGCPQSKPECAPAEREVTSLTEASHDPNPGEAAEVQGTVRVAPDGSRVYFVARGILSSAANVEGAVAVRGADNLYVYDSVSGQTAFIGDLCSGFGLSGVATDVHCPSETKTDEGLWGSGNGSESGGEPDGSEAQTAGKDGRFLVFASVAQLASKDTDTVRDVYRFDAVTGELDRVSHGEAGADANGNNDAFDAQIAYGHYGGAVRFQHELDSRAISEDGSRIVFRTKEPLSPGASNGQMNVYEWHKEPGSSGEGDVSLISTGTGAGPVEDVVISPSGRDVFFVTSQGLMPQDTDGVPDIYDARLGGGFRAAAAPAQPCSGDACQGPLTNPAPLLVPGSVSQAPGENVPTPSTVKLKPKVKKAAKRKKKKKIARRRAKAKKASGRSKS